MKIKHFILLFLFSLIALYSYSQRVKNNSVSREVIIELPDSLIKCRVLNYKPDIDIEDNLVYYWYYSGKIHKNSGHYAGYLLHDNYIVLDSEKNMLTKGTFFKGTKHGIWKTWYPKGGLKSSKEWKKGLPHGKWTFYDATGNLIKQEYYKEGKKTTAEENSNEGIFRRFFKD